MLVNDSFDVIQYNYDMTIEDHKEMMQDTGVKIWYKCQEMMQIKVCYRDDFNFPMVNFPFISSNMSVPPAYWV